MLSVNLAPSQDTDSSSQKIETDFFSMKSKASHMILTSLEVAARCGSQ